MFSRAFSEFANSMYLIILPLVILDISGSLADVSLFFTVSKLPAVILLPLFGVMVEKVKRKPLIVSCNFFTFLLFGIQLLLFRFGHMQLFLLTAIGILINMTYSISDVATRVIFTELVPVDELEKYNGTKSVFDNVATFVAPMLGTFMYGYLGASPVITLIFLLFGIAGAVSALIKYVPRKVHGHKDTHVFREIKEGLLFVKARKSILAFFVLASSLNFFVGATEEVINPGILLTKYHISKQYFGFASTFVIAGIILGSLFIARHPQINYQKYMSRFFLINSGIMILIGLTSVLLFGRSKLVFYGIFLFLEILVGIFTILINVPLTSYFQANVPIEYQGRFFSVLSFAAQLSIPFGISYTGMLAQGIGADYAFIANNLCIILIVIFTFKRYRILDSEGREALKE